MAAILPAADSFDEGATAYGAALCGYIAAGFWTAQTLGSHGSQTVGFQPLHDGYTEAVTRKAAFAGRAIGEFQAGVMLRDFYSASDVLVRMTQHASVFSGAVTDPNKTIAMQMVGARISGGTASVGTTPVSAADPQRIVDVDLGYFFGYVSDASAATWFLLKVGTGGVVTVLDSTAFAGSGLLEAEIDPFQPHTLTLDVQDSGGTTNLVATATQSGQALDLGFIVANNLGNSNLWGDKTFMGSGTASSAVFTYADSATPIQTAGRVGFISTGFHQAAGGDAHVAVLIDSFGYKLAGGGAWSLDDTFDHFERSAAFGYTAGASGLLSTTDPRDLRCTWGGDYFAKTSEAGVLIPSSAPVPLDRVEATETGSTETTGGFYPSQRKATDPKSSHRQIQFRFDTVGTFPTVGGDFRQIGIGARAGALVTEPSSGYEADIRPGENALTGAIFLRRWEGTTTPTTIAEVTGLTVTPGTDYTLALRVYNLPDAQGNQDGIVVLEVYHDGGLVPLVAPSSPVSGVTIQASGTVYDSSALRTISGSGEWLRLAATTGVTASLVVDTWTELSLQGTPGGAEGAEASITVSTETTGHLTGTAFANEYDWPLEEDHAALRREFRYASGDVSTRLLDANTRRTWGISAAATTSAERTSLRSLWATAKGTELSFEFTPPGESTVRKVHFASPQLGAVLRAPGVYGFQFALEEVLG